MQNNLVFFFSIDATKKQHEQKEKKREEMKSEMEKDQINHTQ